MASIIFTLTAQLLKLAVGLIMVKAIAYYLGSAGLGQLGHFLSLVSITTMLAGGGITNGIIKYVSEFKHSPLSLYRFVETSTRYSASFTAVALVLGIALCKPLSEAIFKSSEYYWVIILLSTCQAAFSFTNIVFGVANGLGKPNVHSKIIIFGNLIGLPASIFLIGAYGIPGAAIALLIISTTQSIPAYYYYRRSIYRKIIFKYKPRRAYYSSLFGYTGMLMASALAFPVVEIVIRERLIYNSGFSMAGTWQAAIRLASAYLSFFGVVLAYYFMPKVSAELNKQAIARLTCKMLSLVVVLYVIFATFFYSFRHVLIPLLFSTEFTDLSDNLIYQLTGDLFKMAAQVIGYISVAKAATRLYIGAEFIQSFLFFGIISILFEYTTPSNAVFVGAMTASIVYFAMAAGCFVYWVKRT